MSSFSVPSSENLTDTKQGSTNMKKKVHLLCNAHIDSVWQWEWEEGASSALSTFQSAVNLMKDFDYIFNHNEVNLYQYTARYSPALYQEIKEKAKEGKWNISGGWYLQPDVLLPQGEAIIRQIQTGKEFFTKEFNQYPKTAINFDSFGHSRGLVQIIKKCGQENYIFMRPFNKFVDPKKYQLPLPAEEFLWEGYDGSTIKATRCSNYGSPLGRSVEKIKDDIKNLDEYDVILSTWGVGNHGGGPSRKDLADIKKFQEEYKDREIIHSTPDAYFADINPTVKYDKSLITCMPGCYTSMINMKQSYRELENELFYVEKMCSIASLKGAMVYPVEEFKAVTEDMLNVEFHDLLCGTVIEAGEKDGMNFLGHGKHILNQCRAKAFFFLIKGEKPADPETYPVFVFNPNPYETEEYCEAETCLVVPWDYDNAYSALLDVHDENGSLVPCQTIKEESNICMQWRKRVIFKAKLKPMGITRFYLTYHNKLKTELLDRGPRDIDFKNDVKEVKISAKTGLIESYKVNGVEYANGFLFQLMRYQDYADPWNMNYPNVGTDPVPFKKMEKTHGFFEGLESFEVIEDGPIMIRAEAFFELDDNYARICYTIYKEGDAVDVEVSLFPGEASRAFKLHFPVKGNEFSGEQMFGYEKLYEDGNECIAHDYLTVKNGDKYLQLITPSTYGCSYKDGTMVVTLLRTASYCAHPTYFGPLLEKNIYVKKMDAKLTKFNFRLTVSEESELKRKARQVIDKPYALNVFPTVDTKDDNGIEIVTTNKNINTVTVKKSIQKDGYIIRLENNCSLKQDCSLSVGTATIDLNFGKYEVKTVLYANGKLEEQGEMII